MIELSTELGFFTKRLSLRPLQISDVDGLWPDIADPEISRWMAWDAHPDKDHTEKFVMNEIARRNAGNGVTWAIEVDGRVSGIISLLGILRTHRSLTYDKAELAYWLSRPLQGRGLMTEAGQRVLEFAFREIGLHKVYVSHFAINEASKALIQRLGFRYVGTQKQEFCKDGVWHDHVMYEILDSEYPRL